jgi:K+-transporting ATPase ATPase A chain
MYGMLIFVVLTVFIAGLMVGRTPEYLGKKVEAYDVQMSMLYFLIFPVIILGFAAVSVLAPSFGTVEFVEPRAARALADSVCVHVGGGNNGSAFAGMNANTHWYNSTLGITMLAGRFLMISSDAGGCGQPGDQEDRAAERGHVPGTRRCLRCCWWA